MYEIRPGVIDCTDSELEATFLTAFTSGPFMDDVETFWVLIRVPTAFDSAIDELQRWRHTLNRALSRQLIPMMITSLIVDDENTEHLRALLTLDGSNQIT